MGHNQAYRATRSNPECTNAGRLGMGCLALNELHPGCKYGDCPFFKTHAQQAKQEYECAVRCRRLGIKYHYRDDVINSYYTDKTRKEKYR